MNRVAFLERVAQSLRRSRRVEPETRAVSGVLESFRADPLRGGERDLVRRFELELARVGGTSERTTYVALPSVLERIVGARSLAAFDRREFDALQDASRARAGDAREAGAAGASWRGHAMDDSLAALLARAARAEALDVTAFTAACERAEIGLTTVDAAIAATGSLVLSAASSRPRITSLLPSTHVAIVRAEQIVARLGLAFDAALARGSLPSQLLVVTGPSRTSDIENDLTIGVHGPGAVHVIVVEEER